jgi:hypothetical protein
MASARRRWTDPPGVAVTRLGPPVRCALTRAEPTYLALWGTDRPGRWWALVAWVGYLRFEWRDYEAVCSGWVIAGDTAPVDDADYGRVARVRLGSDPLEWPRPWLASDLHYAPLTRANPALPPNGTRWDSTLPHRRHKAHYELADGRSRRWPPPSYRA